MDQNLLRSYFATAYEVLTESGSLRFSIDGDLVKDTTTLPELLQEDFAILTAYNPRSMLLPKRVNESRQHTLKDLLVLGCYRVEQCVGYDEQPDGFREPAMIVHRIEREEAMVFGRAFRQNTIIYCQNARPELIVTDITCDHIGKTFQGNWRVRS